MCPSLSIPGIQVVGELLGRGALEGRDGLLILQGLRRLQYGPGKLQALRVSELLKGCGDQARSAVRCSGGPHAPREGIQQLLVSASGRDVGRVGEGPLEVDKAPYQRVAAVVQGQVRSHLVQHASDRREDRGRVELRVVAREQPGLAVLVDAPPGHLAERVFQELAAAVRLPAGVHPHACVRIEELQLLGGVVVLARKLAFDADLQVQPPPCVGPCGVPPPLPSGHGRPVVMHVQVPLQIGRKRLQGAGLGADVSQPRGGRDEDAAPSQPWTVTCGIVRPTGSPASAWGASDP